MAYDAFISYSHGADSELAPRVQDGLQRLAKPWWRRRSLDVFRDTTGLSANPGLWSSIESAMDDSEWFVFLASPAAAESPWVDRELSHWLETRGPDRVLPVLTEGTWVWNEAANDFDTAASSAVPLALLGAFAEEPRHVDLSWARTEEQLDLRNARFRDQIAELAAPIHGMAKDDLEGADVREHRRTLRAAWGAAAALLLLALVSVVAGIAALRNADEAASQRSAAEQRATEAEQARLEADRSATEAENSKLAAEESEAEAKDSEQKALDSEKRAKAGEKAAEDSATAARKSAEAERAAAAIAVLRTQEATEQRDIAKKNEQKATAATARAEQEKRAAVLAKRKEEKAKLDAQASERMAERRRVEAVKERKEAERLRRVAEEALSAEEVARRQAETESLASASKATASLDGPLSLLLAVEASDRSRTTPGVSVMAAVPGWVGDEEVTGRRALFEAVTATQGGVDAFRVDRYLAWPSDVQDPPAYLVKPTISADGRYLAAAEIADPYRGLRGPVPTRVFVWDLAGPRPTVRVLSGHVDSIGMLAFAGGGRTLISQDVPYDPSVLPTVRVWDTATGAQRIERHALAYVSPDDGSIVLQAYRLPIVELVDGATGAWRGAIDGWVSVDPFGTYRSARRPEAHREPFSPDGRYALIEGVGGATLWDLGSGGLVTLADPTVGFSQGPRVSPDGSIVAAIENGTELALWGFDPTLSTGSPYVRLGSEPVAGQPLVNLVWSPDGSRLALHDVTGLLLVVDLDGDATDGSFADYVEPGEVTFTPDGSAVVTARPLYDEDGFLLGYPSVVHDVATGTLLGAFEGEVLAVDDARRVYVERLDLTLAVVEPGGRTALADATDGQVFSHALSPSGRWLAVSGTGGVRVFDLWIPGTPVSTAGPATQIQGLAFRPGTTHLVGVGVGSTGVVWDLSKVGSGEVLGTAVRDSTVLADGVTVLEPLADLTGVRFRDVRTGATRPGPALPAGVTVDYVVAPPEDGPVVINLRDGAGAVVARTDGTVVGRTVGQIAVVSRDGTRLVERDSARSVRVLDAADLSVVRRISLTALPEDDVDSAPDVVAVDPSGRLLAATNATGDTVVWNVASGAVVTTLPGRSVDRITYPLFGLAFSPDGTKLVVKTPSNDVRMYEVSTSSDWAVAATQRLPGEYAGRVVFSPDGTLVVVDGLYLLDGRTLDPIVYLRSSPGAVTRFSSDGRFLVTVSSPLGGDPAVPRAVTRWTLDAEMLRSEACRIAGRGLTIDERNRYLADAAGSNDRDCPA